jgi:hypothetical protein
VTSGDEIRTPDATVVTRRAAGAAARSTTANASRPKARWSRRRGVAGVFAGLAAFGFVAASLVPVGFAMAEPAAADTPPTTVYASILSDAQSFTVTGTAVEETIDFQRDGYTAYQTPKPEPEPVVTAPPATASSSSSSGGGGSSWSPPFVSPDPGSAQAIAYDMVRARGWGDDEFACLVALWNRESGWRVNAYNAGSGAYGIPQSLPGSKMASAGADWETNPATQISWGLGYISGRYGAPCGAWGHSNAKGWY